MPQFSRIVVGPGVKFPVDDQTGAQTRAECQEHHVLRPFAGSESPFSQSAGICIIVKRGRYAEPFRQDADNRNIVPAGQIGRGHDNTGSTVKRTAATYSDRADIPGIQHIPFQDILDRSFYVGNRAVHPCRRETHLILYFDASDM